jgi:phenylpropionate dioxygenase-like ring-hydroxylating dioxygenase large terminal subunit
MRCTWKVTLNVAANWKLILENAVETYHIGIVHRDTLGARQSRTPETRGDWIAIHLPDAVDDGDHP